MSALAELKATNQDFELYPTTEEIILAFHGHVKKFEVKSLLDIGAGNGKVLNRFRELSKDSKTELFAIEKARPLLDSLPAEIAILGTDFWDQSLLDKRVDCIFSNPHYSEFIDWTTKLIKEAYTHFKLDYRIVISLHGAAVCAGGYNSYLSRGGLSESAANFIDDIIVNARNLGFDSEESVDKHNFVRGEKEAFYCTDKRGRRQVLMEVRAYANGNMHIKFNQGFMLALNVEAGRLLGWVHNAQQAASEMEESIDKVSDYFNTSYALKNDSTVTALLTQ